MSLEQSGALLNFLWWEDTQQPKRLAKASTAPSDYRSMQEALASSSSLKYVLIWWIVRHDHSCAQRHWADSPEVQLFPAQVRKRNRSSRASHYQLWQDISPLSAGNEKHKTKAHPETQQNINSFVYAVPLLSRISLALEWRNSCEGGNSAVIIQLEPNLKEVLFFQVSNSFK